MGEEDIRRQRLNVFSMKLLGAEVAAGHQRLADAARRHQRGHARLDGARRDTHYIIGSVVGPHPFPRIVRDFQSVIGRETRAAVPGADRPAARRGRRLRRRRQQRGRHVLSVRRPTQAWSWSASRPAAAAQARRPCRHAQLRPARRAARQLQLRPAGRRRPDGDVHSRLGRPRLSRRRPRAQLLERHRPRPYTSVRDDEALDAFDALARAGRHPARPGKLARRGRGDEARRRSGSRTRSSSSASPAAATRTRPRLRGCGAWSFSQADVSRLPVAIGFSFRRLNITSFAEIESRKMSSIGIVDDLRFDDRSIHQDDCVGGWDRANLSANHRKLVHRDP